MLCLLVLCIVEHIATQHVLEKSGEHSHALRVHTMLLLYSVLCAGWCYFNSYIWHTVWCTQMQLEAEQESSKSLLSMVCDATFWVSQDGDTILRSTRQFDALLGCHADLTQLCQHVPKSESLRVRDAIARQAQQPSVSLLPTSLFRDGKVATDVDLFIV